MGTAVRGERGRLGRASEQREKGAESRGACGEQAEGSRIRQEQDRGEAAKGLSRGPSGQECGPPHRHTVGSHAS